MSGGDPMVLNNSKIAAWLAALAEAGVESIRIGTKEMAFYPERFDDAFVAMLDEFHKAYPEVGLHIVVHFEHPDEFLAKDPGGNYIRGSQGFLQWVPATGAAMRRLAQRGWLSVENQTPIMRDINDDPDALRIMQREFKRAGGENHYFFCGRDIIAYRAFNVPIERAWQTLNESQKGLSGVESHARLSITHYKGKTEVNAVTNQPIPGLKGSENGVVIFKILRSAGKASDKGKVCIVARNPEALWFDDYADRVLFDEAGLYDYSRVKSARVTHGAPSPACR
jgi:L-lysine 2,3-aminomutase